MCSVSICSLLLLFCISTNAVNQTLIDQYRNDFMSHMLNDIPFILPTLAMQNVYHEPTQLADDTVIFYLFNRKNPYTPVVINKDPHHVNPHLPVKMLVHGWTEHYYVTWCKNMTAAYLRKGKYNVIVLDWSKKGDANYISASMSVRDVSNLIGDFIVEKLMKERKVKLKRVHLVSHSLGAHVAGLTGQRVLLKSGQKVSRITALDPAAPIFDMFPMGNADRLSPDDADFVDIIHTDGGVLGFKTSIGSVDFYPNGGTAVQPGCSLMKTDVRYEDLFCSHARSHLMFLRSIVDPDIKAIRCDSWDRYAQGHCNDTTPIVFGDNAPNNISGSYFLRTPDNLLPRSLA